MGLIDELFSKSTGMKGLLEGTDPNNPGFGGSTESDALQNIVNKQSQPPTNQTEASALQNILANQKRPNQNIGSKGSMVPPKKPDDLSQLDPSLFVKIFGRTKESMSNEWKNKGGFEALMANPGFTLGLSLMKTSAQGKPIGEGMFDAAIKSGAISKQYADQIKKRQGLLEPVSESQRESMKSVVGEQGITAPGLLDKMKSLFGGGNAEAMYNEALDDIYVEAERLAKKDAAGSKTKVRFDPRKYGKQAIKNLQASGKLIVRKDRIYRAGTLQAKTSKIEGRAEGGPIQSGQDYIVGEKGPEMFVSETNGTIINNDDSKVVSMLLESNPQLKNVSKARAVKILKARFPDYF